MLEANICASIVTFFPNTENLKEQLICLQNQVTAIVIINNSPEIANDIAALLQTLRADLKKHVITPEKNLGVSAHNLSINWARNENFKYILFLDQDSCPAKDMVAQLQKVDTELRQQHYQLAAVGPRAVDSRTEESGGFLRFVGLIKSKCHCDNGKSYCPTDSLMFSGMLVRLDVFAAVGLFDDSLFMDNVDTEWGLRAKSKGWHSFGACKAILKHRVGDHVVECWGRKFYIHNPWRQYYIFRNRIALYKRSYIPIAWKINDLAHIFYKILLHTFAISPRREYLKNIFRGLWDGLFKNGTTKNTKNTKEEKILLHENHEAITKYHEEKK